MHAVFLRLLPGQSCEREQRGGASWRARGTVREGILHDVELLE